MLVGDFNYDLLTHEKNEIISSFLNMTLQNNFQPCITAPTRIVEGNKPSLVDNIFSNSIENVISGNLFEKISDHMPNFVIIENVKYNNRNKTVKRRDMKTFDQTKFEADLRNSILHEITVTNNIKKHTVFSTKNF